MNSYDTGALIIVGIAAMIHLNRMHGRRWIECAGFACIAAGALGRACEFWWPGPASGAHASHFLYTGLAILALKLANGDLQRMLNYDKALQNFPRNVLEAATVAESREDFHLVKVAAHAALAREGDKRVIHESGIGGDAFLDQRFNRQG